MVNNVNKISFGSKIIVSSAAYLKAPRAQLAQLGKYVDQPWTIYDSRYLREGFSEYASYCTMGVIKNKDGDAFMFHLVPYGTRKSVIGEHLEKAAAVLSKKSPLSGFLVGGNAYSKESVDHYKFIEEVFNALKIPYSKLLGQKLDDNIPEAYCNFYYNGQKDSLIVNPPEMPSKVYHEIKNAKSVKDKLQKIFRSVFIESQDTIKFN